MVEQLEYRMYGLVPYNLSPIQQGIQFGHAVQEYNNMIGENLLNIPWQESFEKWSKVDKTFIILNGGTTRTNPSDQGTMQNHIDTLQSIIGDKYETFKEPDLNNALTAVVFLVDERVWDKEKYPDRDKTMVDLFSESESNYAERLGGEQNVKLREFLSQFRLA